VHSTAAEYGSLKPRRTKKKIFSQLKGMSAGKHLRIFSLNHKIIVLLGFSDKTRNFTTKTSIVDTKIISPRSKRFRKVFRTFKARLKNEKCLERAENLMETLATQCLHMTISISFHNKQKKYKSNLKPL